VFLPVAAQSGTVSRSLAVSLPLLFIAMSTFILNDIDDVETDKVNHPERPLPSGQMVVRFATAVYFLSLALALFTTKIFVPGTVSFLYYLLLVLSINYKYVAEHFPSAKAIYVACASTFPILVAVSLLQSARLYPLVGATFFFVVGREFLLDYLDRPGDPKSLITNMSRKRLTLLAFAFQAAGLALLIQLAREEFDILAVCLIAALSLLSLFIWVASEKPGLATDVMKVQMYGGVYFLFQW
jgi:geranylgeranylglycerol-phosphate geranylgeranyltransferase